MPGAPHDEPDDAAARSGPVLAPTQAPLFDSAALFGRQTEIGIAHAGVVYRLRITRQGKLILNK